MRRFATALAAILAPALSGCWISEKPLMPASAKDMPQLEGRYVQLNSDGTEAGLATIEPLYGQFRATLERGAKSKQVYALRFAFLFDNWYVVQAIPDGQDGPEELAFFRLLRQQGDHWLEFDPDCGEETSSLDGVDPSGGDCRFDNYASVLAAARIEAHRIDVSEGSVGEFSGSYVPQGRGR